MEILFSEDDEGVKLPSHNEMFQDYLYADIAGNYTPIEFDYLDYLKCIDCSGKGKYEAVTHPVIIEFGEKDLAGEDREIDILFPDEGRNVVAHSSIDQYRKFIATYERGGWAPIEFDFLDYVNCISCDGGDKYEAVTHPVIIEFDDAIGYNFPIGECAYDAYEYPKFDRMGTELRVLPEEMGDGFYEAVKEGEEIVNFDNAAVGTMNNYRLKVGQDYYLAADLLPGDGD